MFFDAEAKGRTELSGATETRVRMYVRSHRKVS